MLVLRMLSFKSSYDSTPFPTWSIVNFLVDESREVGKKVLKDAFDLGEICFVKLAFEMYFPSFFGPCDIFTSSAFVD